MELQLITTLSFCAAARNVFEGENSLPHTNASNVFDIIHCMEKSNILTLRIDSGLKKKLDRLAKSTQRSRSFLAAEAIREYVSLNEWQIEEIQKAIQQADAGDFATREEVEEMFKKWARRAR
jgi:predicted transcriptional regulator